MDKWRKALILLTRDKWVIWQNLERSIANKELMNRPTRILSLVMKDGKCPWSRRNVPSWKLIPSLLREEAPTNRVTRNARQTLELIRRSLISWLLGICSLLTILFVTLACRHARRLPTFDKFCKVGNAILMEEGRRLIALPRNGWKKLIVVELGKLRPLVRIMMGQRKDTLMKYRLNRLIGPLPWLPSLEESVRKRTLAMYPCQEKSTLFR